MCGFSLITKADVHVLPPLIDWILMTNYGINVEHN